MVTPHFIDSLQWYRDDYSEARWTGNTARQELGAIFDLFAKNQRLNRERARDYLEEGQRLSRSDDGHPFWELLFDYWHYTLTSPGVGDVDAIVRLFMKANQGIYRECPILGRIYTAMIEAYVWADPISYADDIRQAIEYTLSSIPIERDTYQRILLAKSRMHYELREHESTLEAAKTLLKYSDDYAPDTINAYLLLAQSYLALQDYDDAFNHARLAYDTAQAHQSLDFQRAALVVQATVLAHQRDFGGADVMRFQMRELDWQGAKWLDLAFDAELSYWRVVDGLWGKFVSLRFAKQVLEYYVKQNQSYWICRARYDLLKATLDSPVWLRWLYRTLLTVPTIREQVQLAEEAANHLKQQDWYLDRISAIAYDHMQ